MSVADDVAAANEEELTRLRAEVRQAATELVAFLRDVKNEVFRNGRPHEVEGRGGTPVLWSLLDPHVLLPYAHAITEDAELVVTRHIPRFFGEGDWSPYALIDIDQLSADECREFLARFKRVKESQ